VEGQGLGQGQGHQHWHNVTKHGHKMLGGE
jgi:hypothetical protein